MKIEKVINNNVVCSSDEQNLEVVVMGRGIGFKAYEGKEIDNSRIEKIFRIDNPAVVDQFKELLTNIPLEHIQLSNDVISYAKKSLNLKLNQNIYVTLTDHINFTIQRYNQGMKLSNALLWEIKRFYHQEYMLGEYAVDLVNKRLGIKLVEDEAGFIALHFVNAQYDTTTKDTIHIANLIQKALILVRETFDLEFDEGSLHYERFVTHLKFLSQRIFRKELLLDEEVEFAIMMCNKYAEEHKCAEELAKYIEEEFGTGLSKEEILYLTIHIRRVRISGSNLQQADN